MWEQFQKAIGGAIAQGLSQALGPVMEAPGRAAKAGRSAGKQLREGTRAPKKGLRSGQKLGEQAAQGARQGRKKPSQQFPRNQIPRQPMPRMMPPPRAPIPRREDAFTVPARPVLQASSMMPTQNRNVLGASTQGAGVEQDINRLQNRNRIMKENLNPTQRQQRDQERQSDFIVFLRALFDDAPWNR